MAKIEMILSTDGKHSIWAKDVDIAEADDALSVVEALYDGVVEKYGTKNFMKKTGHDFADSIDANAPQDKEWCKIHNCRMYQRQGKYGPFYSHKVEGTENEWCNGKPKAVPNQLDRLVQQVAQYET